jgi:RNA polymerase sigma-70 factor (ECF subfamily)
VRGCPPEELQGWIADQHQCPQVDSAQCLTEIAGALETLARQLASQACARVLSSGDAQLGSYVRRLWGCLEYHWRRFAAHGRVPYHEVVSRIEKGELAYGRVTANVLRDVTLAQALELKEANAAERFEADYMPTVRAIAGRMGGPAAVDAVENLAAELILPRGDRPPRIATFRGKTPLGSWLRSVVANYWVSLSRRQRARSTGNLPDPAACEVPSETLDRGPCLDLLRPMFCQAVGELQAEDRMLLKMLILDQVPQNRLAASLGLHPGTLTRRRQRAAAAVLAGVQRSGASSSNPARAFDCLQLVLAGADSELQRGLADLLASEVRKEDPSIKEEDL